MQFIVTAILARLLAPSDFGLIAMATVFINFAMIFSEMGISSALIQKQDTHDRHYSSAFWLNVGVGLVLTAVFFLAAPLIALFYKKPELTPLLRVISLNFIFASFTIIQQTILTKEMDFKKLAIRDLWALIISGGISIYLAYHGFGVWSLIYQMLSFTLINSILLWILSPWRPKWAFGLTDIRDIFIFSANLTGFQITNYFSRNIDQLLIGKFLGAQALGYYSLAYKIMLYPVQHVSQMIGKVIFPAFAKIQLDLLRLRANYLKMIKVIALVSVPLMLGLFAIAPDFVAVVLGPRWKPLVLIIRIFCLCGIAQSVGTTVGNIFLACGRPDLQFKLSLLGSMVVTLAILIGMRWGITGVASAYMLQSVIWVLVTFPISNHLIGLKDHDLILSLIKPSIIGVILCGAIVMVKQIIIVPDRESLILSIVIATVLYFLMLLISKEIKVRHRKLTLSILD